MPDNINEPDQCIASYYPIWLRNRHVIDGERAIRQNCEAYLPRHPHMTVGEYRSFIHRVPFFPAASRTLAGLIGLMFRKAPTIQAPENLLPILNTITRRGDPIGKLGEMVARELLITNFIGLLVDYPPSPVGLSLSQAQATGHRPSINLYRAESILKATPGIVGNRQVLVRVCLKEEDGSVRELVLIDGVYTVIMHRDDGTGSLVPEEPVIPLANGKPLDRIPFVIGNTEGSWEPTIPPMSDMCAHNIQYFLAQANLAQTHHFSSTPIYVVTGADVKPEDLPVYPGAAWTFDKETAKAEILEYKGTSVEALRQSIQDIKEEMAAIGSRILASEKAAKEAADALAIRRASENAVLASTARIVSRIVNDALHLIEYWMGLGEGTLEFEVNTDFNPSALSSLDLTARLALVQANVISKEAFIEMMIDSGDLPETFDYDLDQSKIAEEDASLPPTDTGPVIPPIQ
ncbi:MAG: DUF4055 domain-containing protein [Sphingomonas sp.]|uniref:DUF4055 domain-containing protein n=1 Tax=Sphingomonas sp. TaxID=28214 RepID=UPI00122B62EB|nr:DUF4055 domain-containing protein [Sphingomonas sp.]THD35704.1 MAG: DUF4055 domain-containing protein [Sphingomonas sp.]